MITKNNGNTFDKNQIDPKYLDLGLLFKSFESDAFCQDETGRAAHGIISREEYTQLLTSAIITELNKSADIRERIGHPPFDLLMYTNMLLGICDFHTTDNSSVH